MERAARLEIKVAAGASKNALQGFAGDVLKLAVTAAPERGRANKAVCALLADVLQVPVSALDIARGATRPRKVLTVQGLDAAELRARLNAALS